jgi:hypothetical protein
MLPTRQGFHVGTVESTLKELTLPDEPLVGGWVLKLGKKHCGISGRLDTIHLPRAHGSRQVEFNSRLPEAPVPLHARGSSPPLSGIASEDDRPLKGAGRMCKFLHIDNGRCLGPALASTSSGACFPAVFPVPAPLRRGKSHRVPSIQRAARSLSRYRC